MKKLVSIWSLAALALLLCGCQPVSSSSGGIPSSLPETQSSQAVQSSSSEGEHTPPYLNSVDYDTVEALIKGITNDFTEDVLQKYEAARGGEARERFEKYLVDLNTGVVPLYVPYYQGKEMKFQNKEGFANISLFPRDLYDRPEIIYAGNNCGFSILYLDEEMKEEANQNGAAWLVKQMNPNGTGEDAQPYLPYDEMVEKEIVLQDRTVKALACHYKDDARIWTYIVYDDVLVLVSNSPDDECFKDLSFEKISVRG